MWCQNPMSSSVQLFVLTCCAHVNLTHLEGCFQRRIWAFMAISLFTPEPWLTALCHLSPGPGVCSLNPQLLAKSLFWTDRSWNSRATPIWLETSSNLKRTAFCQAPCPSSPFLKDTTYAPFGEQKSSYVLIEPESLPAPLVHCWGLSMPCYSAHPS